MPQLDITTFPSQIFWLCLSFGLLYLLVNARILPKIKQMIDAREATVKGDMDRARSLRTQAELLKQEYELALHEAHQKASALLQDASAKTAKLQDERTLKLENSLKHQTQEAEARIQALRVSIFKDMEQVAMHAAGEIVEKFLGKPVSEAEVKQQLKAS